MQKLVISTIFLSCLPFSFAISMNRNKPKKEDNTLFNAGIAGTFSCGTLYLITKHPSKTLLDFFCDLVAISAVSFSAYYTAKKIDIKTKDWERIPNLTKKPDTRYVKISNKENKIVKE